MTHLCGVIEHTKHWLELEGVEMIIPALLQNSIYVLTSSNPTLVKKHIPEEFMGYPVLFVQIRNIQERLTA